MAAAVIYGDLIYERNGTLARSPDERAGAKSGTAEHSGTAHPDFAWLIWAPRYVPATSSMRKGHLWGTPAAETAAHQSLAHR
jgi:hypothetical protein